MLSAIIVTLVIVAALGYALRTRSTNDLIIRRPYNNIYSDAPGARDDNPG